MKALHHLSSIPSHFISEFAAQSFSALRDTNPQQWPRTMESVATATVQQAPAPRRMAATAATAATVTAPQEPAQRRTEASAATATALPEPAPRNRAPAIELMALSMAPKFLYWSVEISTVLIIYSCNTEKKREKI